MQTFKYAIKVILGFVFSAAMMPSAIATTYQCSTTQQIIDAMSLVQAGDEIVIAPGTYVSPSIYNGSYFYSEADGTAANPITIRSQSSTNKAHLQGYNSSAAAVLRIKGNYWIVEDLEMSNARTGLIFDDSHHSIARNCEVHYLANEGIHVRDGSDYVTIDNCTIYDTGNVNPGYGEGIYIGTDKSSWSTYDPYVDHTVVKNCTIGPNVRAEPFDIKEGTSETTIEYNVIDATGISGVNFSDSFIDLKGTRAYVRYNTFNQNNASALTKGIAVIYRSVALSSYEHVVHDNTFNMSNTTSNIYEAYSNTSETYAFNNTRNPSGSLYNSRITESCPTWYGHCNGSGNQLPTVSISSPTTNSSFNEGDNISISASASDSDGSITLVEFYLDGSKIGEDPSSPYNYTWSNALQGSYTLSAVATDNDGGQTTSSNISVSVIASGGGPTGNLLVEYNCGDTDASNNRMRPYLKIVNNGSSGVDYDDLTLRYWFTKEGSASVNLYVDYAVIGKNNVSGTFNHISGNDYYLEVSFDPAAGSLSSNDDSGVIKLRMSKSDWSSWDETNDYSFDPSVTSYSTFDKVTLYQNGTLIWGNEPPSNNRSHPMHDLSAQTSEPLEVYPNPTSGVVNIIPTNEGVIQLMDATGRLVQRRTLLHTTSQQMDLSQLNNGIYYLRFIADDGEEFKKLIKY